MAQPVQARGIGRRRFRVLAQIAEPISDQIVDLAPPDAPVF